MVTTFLSSFIYYMDCSVDIVLHVKFKYLFARFMCHYNSLHQIKKLDKLCIRCLLLNISVVIFI